MESLNLGDAILSDIGGASSAGGGDWSKSVGKKSGIAITLIQSKSPKDRGFS